MFCKLSCLICVRTFALGFFLLSVVQFSSAQFEPASAPIADPADTRFKGWREDWTTPALSTSTLKAVPPLIASVDDTDTYTTELGQIEWRGGDPLDLYVVRPKGVKKPPVILYLYNYATNTDRFMLTNVCQSLTAGGVAAVGFSLALSGHRFHDRGATEWFVSEFQEALTTSTHDVQKVIDYLETRQDMDTKRIGIFGQGSGAAVAILAAKIDPRIKVLDLEDAWGDWPNWLSKSTIIPEAERGTYLTPAFLKGVEELDPVRHLPKLKIPLHLQYSLPKSAVPAEAQKQMEAALPRKWAHTPVEANFNWIKKQLAEMGSSDEIYH